MTTRASTLKRFFLMTSYQLDHPPSLTAADPAQLRGPLGGRRRKSIPSRTKRQRRRGVYTRSPRAPRLQPSDLNPPPLTPLPGGAWIECAPLPLSPRAAAHRPSIPRARACGAGGTRRPGQFTQTAQHRRLELVRADGAVIHTNSAVSSTWNIREILSKQTTQ